PTLREEMIHRFARDDKVLLRLIAGNSQLLRAPMLREQMIRYFENDDETLLQLLVGNVRHSNSLFGNFFQYYQGITAILRRNGVGVPKVIFEIGSGTKPYTGLRFLIEGAERYFANDVREVQSTFGVRFVEALRTVYLMMNPSSESGFDRILK